jgi:hypothetical protein
MGMGMGGEDEMAVDGGEDTEEDVVPTVCPWEHGGRQVYIQGNFNNWERQIPMPRSGNDFTYIHLQLHHLPGATGALLLLCYRDILL